MKALSLTQPWATLIQRGSKRIETRSWATNYRGRIAIHAAKRFPAAAKDLCLTDVFRRGLRFPEPPQPLTQEWFDDIAERTRNLPLGKVICTARLVNCLETDLVGRYVQPFTDAEAAFGNYAPGRFAWLLDDVVPLIDPPTVKGALGLWEWSES